MFFANLSSSLLSEEAQWGTSSATNLHMHFESFSTQQVPTNTGVLPQDLEKAISPLDFKTYSNLFKNCSSLIKILRILTLNSFMNSLLSETFETSADISLSKVTVLLQPKAMEKIRKFKDFLQILLSNGLTAANLLYDKIYKQYVDMKITKQNNPKIQKSFHPNYPLYLAAAAPTHNVSFHGVVG